MSHGLLIKAIGPAKRVFSITPDANADLPAITKAIRCDTGGTLVVNTEGGDANVTLHFKDGETRFVAVTRVISATSAAGIEGMA